MSSKTGDKIEFTPFKKYECILNSKTETFEKKIQSIVDVWHSLGQRNLCESDLRYVTHILDWSKLHALNIVLTAEWKDYKAKYEESLLKEIERVQTQLLKISSTFSTRCRKLADVVKNPWEGAILEKLLSQKDAEIGSEEVEFFCVETAYLVSYRLKKLCESQCEDLALNLVTAFMKCRDMSKTQNFNLNATETQMWFIFDIYIALLYKFQENQKIVALLKELPLCEGLQVINRFAKKQVKISKIWKHCRKIAILASQVFISTAAVKFSEEQRELLEKLVDSFITICKTESLIDSFTTSLRRISQLADAGGLYVFCDVVHRKAGVELKPFTIEMYIRALTTDLNNLERQRYDNETDKAAQTTKRLANAFCKLSDLLDEHVKVSRECVLTAFSLEPTEERLNRIVDLARRSGFEVLDTGQEWKCKLHPPVLNKDDVAWICNSCGDWMCKPQLNVPLNTNIALNEALQADHLGISPQLCDDLAVCLSNPRYQVLSWLLPWEDLHRICVMYRNDPERTKNVVTELKFVDIDYSIFKNIKREPVDELAGIEKGYEHYLDHDFTSDDQMSTISEDSASQDSRPYSLGSDGAGDMPYLPLLPQPKSDPNTLKSLRMFRPNLKRPKPLDPGQSVIPEKLFKSNNGSPSPSIPYASPATPYANMQSMHPHLQQQRPVQYSAVQAIERKAQQLNKTMPDPKNGLVATLPPFGGQVATNQLINKTTLNIQPQQQQQPVAQLPSPVHHIAKEPAKVVLQKKLSTSGTSESNKNEPLKCTIVNSKQSKILNIKAESSSNSTTSLCKTGYITKVRSIALVDSNTKKLTEPINLLPKYTSNSILSKPKTLSAQEKRAPDYKCSEVNNKNNKNTTSDNRKAVIIIDDSEKNSLSSVQKGVNNKIYNECRQPNKVVILDNRKSVFKPENTEKNCKSQVQKCENSKNAVVDELQNPESSSMPPLQKFANGKNDSIVVSNNRLPLVNTEKLDKNAIVNSKKPVADLQEVDKSCQSLIQKLRSKNISIVIKSVDNPQDVEINQQAASLKLINNKNDTEFKQTKNSPEVNKKADIEQKLVNNKSNTDCKQDANGDRKPVVVLENIEKNSQLPIQNLTNTKNDTVCKQNKTGISDNKEAVIVNKEAETNSEPLVQKLVNSKNGNKKSHVENPQLPKQTKSKTDCKENKTENLIVKEDAEKKSQPPVQKLVNNKNANRKSVVNPQNVDQNSQLPIQNLTNNKTDSESKQNKILTSDDKKGEETVIEVVTKSLQKLMKSKNANRKSLVIPKNSEKNSPLPKQTNNKNKTEENCQSPVQKLVNSKNTNKKSIANQQNETKQNKTRLTGNRKAVIAIENVEKDSQSPKQKLANKKNAIRKSVVHTQDSGKNSQSPMKKSNNKNGNLDNKKQVVNGEDSEKSRQPPMQKLVNKTTNECKQNKNKISVVKDIDKSPAQKLENSKTDNECKQNKMVISDKRKSISSSENADKNCKSQVQKSVNNKIVNLNNKKLLPNHMELIEKIRQSSMQKLSNNKNENECKQTKNLFSDNRIPIVLLENSDIIRQALLQKLANNKIENKNEKVADKRKPVVNPGDAEGPTILNGHVMKMSSCNTDPVPKINLTEALRIYANKKSSTQNGEMKDCVKTPIGGDQNLLKMCKNVNSQTDTNEIHSPVVQNNKFTLKELKVVLNRIPRCGNPDAKNCIVKDNHHFSKLTVLIDNKLKCDRGTGIYKHGGRRRKSNDKSENNINEKAPKRVQNYKLSPLQDINPRVPSIDKDGDKDKNSKINKIDCDDKIKFKPQTDNKNLQVMLERLPILKKTKNESIAKSILANVPGLNDFQMIRPSQVNQIVNVVQISGGRPTSSVTAQNTQTSTQVSPHIQRIGQPRTDKPEQTNNTETSSTSTSTNASTTTTSVKPSTSQPSTLINILSQQITRPGQSNCVRTRPSPLINILSQQVVRPGNPQVVQKIVTSNAIATTDTQVNNAAKVTTASETITVNTVKNVTTVKNVVATPAPPPTILQFICKSSSLPKFQQAFGKPVYTNNAIETTEATTTNVDTTVVDSAKKTTAKNIPVNVQPIQGSVIYTRQMPVGQAINLIPPGRGQVFRIATSNSDQISLVKDTVIHSKMSALLAAALQGKQKVPETQSDTETTSEDSTKVMTTTVTRPTLVQNARIVKPVLQIPSNVIRTSPQSQSQSSNLSSTTLEQLREFDMVYKQIKERSSSSTPAESSTSPESNEAVPQRISVTYVNQGQKFTQLSPVVVVSSAYCNLQPAASPALSVTSQGSSSPCVTPAPTPTLPKVASKSSKGKTLKSSSTTHASKASPIPKPQQKPQEDEHTTQRIFDILAEYAEQLRNSPDLNNKPAPRRRSNPPTNPSSNSKRKKSSSSKSSKSGQCSSMVSEADIEDQRTMESEDSSCGVVQLSMPEEEPQVQSVTTSESNDSTTSNSRQLILTSSDASGNNQTRNLIIADSSVGEALKMPNTAVLVPGNYIMPVSMVKGGQQIAVVSGGSKILATVPARSGPNMLLFQSFLNQNRKAGVPTVKYSTIQPLSGISSQSLAGVSAQPPVILPPNLTAVALGQPLTLKKIEDSDKINTELLLTISQPRDTVKTETIPQPDSSTSVKEEENTSDNSSEKVFTYQKSIIATPIATPVISQTVKEEVVTDDSSASQNIITMDINADNIKDEIKVERVQSVLVTACTSNGPMLSHTPPRYRKPSDCTTANDVTNVLHNGDKQQNNSEQKHFTSSTVYYQNKKKNPQRLDREIHQLSIQRKQAALERELRLQKSLSEECEDLGVDEPSTSDLFPEADLLFDSNHSPSFDQTSQDLVKRPQQIEIIKEEPKTSMTLFSDDDNSSCLRTNLFEYVDEYPSAETELVYDQSQQLTNGQSSTSNESASSCEDNTLLQNCASMSDVTLNSPISPPDLYTDNTPPSINKYKFKYSNRKKGERNKTSESWATEVSSSEDTTGSTELEKTHSPEPCSNKRSHSISCDDELSDGSFKVVRVAISKTDLLKDDESCEELHCDDDLDCSPSGRGARRSVKKMCSCCNGSQEGGASRKRPSSRPHTPAPTKKTFLNKKR